MLVPPINLQPSTFNFQPSTFNLHSTYSFKDAGGSHSTAYTHRDHAVTGFAALHLVQYGGSQLGARAPKRMAKGNGAAIHVYPLRIHTQLFDHSQGLGRKSLVQFDEVYLVKRESSQLEGLWNCLDRPDSHVVRVYPGCCKCDQLCDWPGPDFARLLGGHYDRGSGSVRCR